MIWPEICEYDTCEHPATMMVGYASEHSAWACACCREHFEAVRQEWAESKHTIDGIVMMPRCAGAESWYQDVKLQES